MPLYTVSCQNTLSVSKKQELAGKIVSTHCELTGAPETFVNVVFWEQFPLPKETLVHIFSAVRKGRTKYLAGKLNDDLAQVVCANLNIAIQYLKIESLEVPASCVMEGGRVLPDPGQEDSCEWLKQS